MWQIVGHEKAVGLLERSLRDEKLSHAYLFVGPRHVGKMTLALNLAQALNCLADEKPCGQCRQCLRIAAGKHTNVQVIGLDGRAEIGIDQIRDMQHFSNLKPGEGRHWVFIIDGAEHLSREAANSLLKTLEEPPPDVELVLLAINDRLLLPTVLSRCQRLELRPLATTIVEQALRHRWGVPPDHAGVLARLSRGCLGWAVAASSDEGLLSDRRQRLSALRHLTRVGSEERFAYAAQLASQFGKDRASVQEMLQLWLGWWRDLMLVREGCGNFATNVDQEAALCSEAPGYSLTQITDFMQGMQRAMEHLDENANPRLVLEVLMLAIPRGKEDRGKTLSEI